MIVLSLGNRYSLPDAPQWVIYFNLRLASVMSFINTLIYSQNRGIRILRHALFWLADLFNWLMVISTNRELTTRDVYFFFATVPIPMVSTYVIIYTLVPKFSSRDKGRSIFYILLVLFLMGLVLRVYKYYIIIPWLNWDPILRSELLNLGGIIGEVFKWLAVVCMAVAIKTIKSRNELQQKNEQLTTEKKMTELSFLKLQMHPHFLFNTLNTLYSETLQNSEKASHVVMHLSNLMRFILEECSKPLIPLENEIKVIRDYIELEKLRHGERLRVKFTAPEIKSDKLLSPLLFLPFVENSFKHSLNNVRGEISINILISLPDGHIKLVVENDHDKNSTSNGFTMGVGVANIKRQLELLYPQTHSLRISDSGNKYYVELVIPSKNNPENG